MEEKQPRVVLFGGPNGAGKTTVANIMLEHEFGIRDFVNADIIARGLSMLDPDRAALAAGRIMLERLNELAAEHRDFAFESTLASRSFATRLRSLIEVGYAFHLVAIWVPSPEDSIGRIADRVSHGGHFVPDETVRRRYAACFKNFFSLYLPIATTWQLLDNSNASGLRTIAKGVDGREPVVVMSEIWSRIKSEFCHDD